LEFAEKFALPRHGQGVIIYALNAIFKKNYPNLAPAEIELYGKPNKRTFDYAKDKV
jgi:ribonucleotide monophosphatase NagD (HAD superfamily)